MTLVDEKPPGPGCAAISGTFTGAVSPKHAGGLALAPGATLRSVRPDVSGCPSQLQVPSQGAVPDRSSLPSLVFCCLPQLQQTMRASSGRRPAPAATPSALFRLGKCLYVCGGLLLGPVLKSSRLCACDMMHGPPGCDWALLGARAAHTRAQGPSRWTSRPRSGAQPCHSLRKWQAARLGTSGRSDPFSAVNNDRRACVVCSAGRRRVRRCWLHSMHTCVTPFQRCMHQPARVQDVMPNTWFWSCHHAA